MTAQDHVLSQFLGAWVTPSSISKLDWMDRADVYAVCRELHENGKFEHLQIRCIQLSGTGEGHRTLGTKSFYRRSA